METEIHLEPLQKYLTNSITPAQLAKILDDLAFDYSRLFIRIQLAGGEQFIRFHKDTDKFLNYLKELRDILWECE